MRKILTLLALMALCATADAGATYGSNATSVFASPITQVGTDALMDGTQDATAPRFRNNTAGTGQQTFTVEWDTPTAGADFKWHLYILERVTRARIVQVRMEDGSGLFATSTNTFTITGAPNVGQIALNVLTPYHKQSDYTPQVGFDFTDVVGVQLTFELDNPGTTNRATIKIDAIANPEPGTLALFGLGLVGLGGLIARRRRRTTPASA